MQVSLQQCIVGIFQMIAWFVLWKEDGGVNHHLEQTLGPGSGSIMLQ